MGYVDTGGYGMGSFDELVDLFRGHGLSEAAARIAATGRGMTEAQARAEWDRSTGSAPLAESARDGDPAAVAIREVTGAAQAALNMTEEQAVRYAEQLHEREKTRHGAEHARQYLGRFAVSLREAVASVR